MIADKRVFSVPLAFLPNPAKRQLFGLKLFDAFLKLLEMPSRPLPDRLA